MILFQQKHFWIGISCISNGFIASNLQTFHSTVYCGWKIHSCLPDHQLYNCKQADWSNDFIKWSTRLIYAGVAAVFTRWLLYQLRSKKCDKNCCIMNGWPTTHIWGSQDQKITKGKRLLSICELFKIEKCKSVRSRESNPSPVNSSLWLSLSLANPLPTKLIWLSCNYLIFDCVQLDLRFCGTADVGNRHEHFLRWL